MTSQYDDLLNDLVDMQASPAYAVRRRVLWQAEAAIVQLEKALEAKPEKVTIWTIVNKPIRDFVNELQPGMLIELETGEKRLIGHWTTDTSTCHGCGADVGMYDTTIVTRYTTIDWENTK